MHSNPKLYVIILSRYGLIVCLAGLLKNIWLAQKKCRHVFDISIIAKRLSFISFLCDYGELDKYMWACTYFSSWFHLRVKTLHFVKSPMAGDDGDAGWGLILYLINYFNLIPVFKIQTLKKILLMHGKTDISNMCIAGACRG